MSGLSGAGAQRKVEAEGWRMPDWLRSWWSGNGFRGLVLVAGALIAYQPVWHAGFIWDDDGYVTHNLLLRSADGLRRIWFEPGATPQYYPLTFTSFWVDYHLWGLHPLGYHVENVLLHAVNAILLWGILRRLGVRGAWLAAALFALHPVCVESVAWVTERKNTLSGFFYLSSGLACIRFWLPDAAHPDSPGGSGAPQATPPPGNARFYWLALALYLCALWSKTAAVSLPAAVLLVVWWQRRSLRWRSVYPLLLFFVVGLVMGLITMSVERHNVGAAGQGWELPLAARCLIAGRVFWFYLGKLFWPHPLIFVYPHWDMHAPQPAAYLPVLAVALGLFALWPHRHGWARPLLFTFGYFLALLFPVLGLFNVYYFRYSFVSDHFQYLASIGPLALAAGGMAAAATFLGKRKLALGAVAGGSLLLALGTLTWRQCGMYADVETLWRTTIARNPRAYLAHNNLGGVLLAKGEVDEAIMHYRKALALQPDFAEAGNNLGSALVRKGQVKEAIPYYVGALRLEPTNVDIANNLGVALARLGDLDEAMQRFLAATRLAPNDARAYSNMGNALAATGRIAEAIRYYRKALEINPNYAEAHNNLGNALAGTGELDEAVLHYEEAIRIDPGYARAYYNLGTALVRGGKLGAAVQSLTEALRLEPDNPEARKNLATALVLMGDEYARQTRIADAIGSYRQALQINPNQAEAHCNLGRALSQLGRRGEAAAHLTEALRLRPDYPAAKEGLRALGVPAPETRP